MTEHSVMVYIYDLSRGLARSMSLPLLGKQLDGIWHTGVTVYGQEFFFGGNGIESCPPCGTILGEPDSKVLLGTTEIPQEMFMEYLQDLSSTTFRPECYHLLDHNCNTFSDEIAHFLTGNNIPAYVTNLPNEVLNTPFGAMIRPFIDAMSVGPEGGHQLFPASSQPTSHRVTSTTPVSSTDSTHTSTSPSSHNLTPQQGATTAEEPPVSSGVQVAVVRYEEPQVLVKYGETKTSFKSSFNSEDFKLLEEICEYVTNKEANWSLGPQHIKLFGSVISGRCSDLSLTDRTIVVGLLQLAVLRQDVLHLLKYDKDHHIMTAISHNIETAPESLQVSIGKILCNIESSELGHGWCSEGAEWTSQEDTTSNSTVTLKTCVACLLAEGAPVTKVGMAIAANMAHYKLSEELAVELGSALIQAATRELNIHSAEHCLFAMHKCMEASTEVTGLAQVMGLDLHKYQELSPTTKQLCQSICEKQQTFAI